MKNTPLFLPLHAAWFTHGCPAPPATPTGQGTCALCAATGAVRPVRAVISDKWTGWERYTGTAGAPMWCDACAWAHSGVDRTQTWLITSSSTVTAPPFLGAALSSPLPDDTAVVIPVGRRKHLLAEAAWGAVVSDDGARPWTPAQAGRFTALLRLRGAGFSAADITTAAAPPWAPLRHGGLTHIVEVMRDWETLTPWRVGDTTTLAAALTITRGPSKGARR